MNDNFLYYIINNIIHSFHLSREVVGARSLLLQLLPRGRHKLPAKSKKQRFQREKERAEHRKRGREMRALSDDSDTDDSDYDPTKDTTRGKDDSGDEGENEQQEAEVLKDVSYLRKRKANDLWEQLNASDRTETEEQIRKSKRFGLANTEGDTVKENKKKKKMKSTKVKSVLAGIFGKTQASSLMNNSYSSSTSSGSSSSKNGAKEAISVEMKEAIRQSVKSIQ